MTYRTSAFGTLGAIYASFSILVTALPAEAITPTNRTVAILFDSSSESTPEETNAHLFIEAPLNALGLVVRYADINQPKALERLHDKNVLAVLSAFPAGTRLKSPLKLINRLERLLDEGKRVLIFGDLAFLVDSEGRVVSSADVAHLLKRFGVEFTGEYATSSIDFRTKIIGEDHTNPTASVLPSYSHVPVLKLVSDQANPVMVGRAFHGPPTATPKSSDIPLITIQKKTGMISLADSAYSLSIGTAETRPVRSWKVNPLTLFKSVLELTDTPRLDLTTKYGSRAIVSLIDGSGWNEISLVEKYLNPPTSSSEALREEVLNKNSRLIFTIAPVVAELDAIKHREEEVARMRAILRSRNVFTAISGYSNVYQWPTAKNKMTAKQEYRNHSTDPEHEIGDAVKEINMLLDDTKEYPCYVASDTSSVSDAAMKYLISHDMCAVIGGGTRLDPLHPNLAWLEPLSLPRMITDDSSKRYPVAFPFASEKDFITLQGSPQYAYRFIDKTITETDAPVRLSPIGIRFGLRAGASPVRLSAIKDVFEKIPENIFPLSLSQYSELVRDFQNAELASCGANCWSVTNRGSIGTVRIDAAKGRWVDYARSTGVLGARVINGELFVALDPSIKNPTIEFSNSRPAKLEVSLLESNWEVQKLNRLEDTFIFHTHGFGQARIRWQVPWSKETKISVQSDDPLYQQQSPAFSFEEGILTIELRTSARTSMITVNTAKEGDDA